MRFVARVAAISKVAADATATDRDAAVPTIRELVFAMLFLAGCTGGNPSTRDAPVAEPESAPATSATPVPGAPAPRPDATAPETPAVEVPAVADTETLPWRVWWRYSDHSGPTIVAAQPGGVPLSGTWRKWYFCGEDGSPSGVWRDEPPKGPEFQYRWITSDVEGVRWRMYTRWSGRGPDPGFTTEQRGLVGHWRHREDKIETELELLNGGLAQTPSGEKWEWISAGPWLELRRPYRNGQLVLNCKLSDDRLRYERRRGDDPPDVVGTRTDAPR